jgi:AraC family transcriptional regulator
MGMPRFEMKARTVVFRTVLKEVPLLVEVNADWPANKRSASMLRRVGEKGQQMSTALRIMHGAFGRVALLDMNRRLVRHAHPHWHVLFKIGGDDTRFMVGETIARLTDTTAVLVNAWQTHAYLHESAQDGALILALYIDTDWLRSFQSNGQASAPGLFERPVGEITPQIRQLVHDLAESMVGESDLSTDREKLLSSLITAVIERFAPRQNIGTSFRERARVQTVDWRVRRAIALMRANPSAAPNIETLAREAGLSRAHFFRLFEQSTGVSPHVLLNALRVESAIGCILEQNESLASISERLGFAAPAHFTRFFRDHLSVSPREFRSVVQSNQDAPAGDVPGYILSKANPAGRVYATGTG